VLVSLATAKRPKYSWLPSLAFTDLQPENLPMITADRWNKSPFSGWLPIHDVSGIPICKLSGILVDSQKHFNAGQKRKFEEIRATDLT
jgi:hypothetical protein